MVITFLFAFVYGIYVFCNFNRVHCLLRHCVPKLFSSVLTIPHRLIILDCYFSSHSCGNMWPSTYITDHKLSGWSVPNLVMKHKSQSSLQPEVVDLLLCEEPKNTYFTCTICHRDVIPSIKTTFQNACRFCCFTHNPTSFYCLEFYFQYSVFAKTPVVGTYKIYIKHLVVLYINIKELLPSTQVKLCDSINFLIQQDLFSGLFLKFIICGCNYTCSALLNAVGHQYWHVLW